jgi:hypothetical protein
MTTSKLYTVVQVSPNHFNIIDASTGAFVNRITLQGTLMSGPIVVGNRCTVVVEFGGGSKFGMIYNLPDGALVNRYSV